MKTGLLLIILSFSFFISNAQDEREPPPQNDGPELRVETSKIYGKILDERTNKGIEAGSVQLIAILKDNSTNKLKDSLFAAMLTKSNGDFLFENLPDAKSFRIIITCTGYKPWIKEIDKSNSAGDGFNKQFEADLGNIMLQTDVQQLGTVTVTATKPAFELGIDRKIFNVEKSLVSTGGTGLDVMKNIPSVSVDVDGTVLLRNASPQIFVDGRPTILTLDQIPADNIERVELITNPSAKYDASSGAGIINVILKKNKRMGLNGIISAGAGTPNQLNGNANVSVREGKMNYFVSGSLNQSGGVARSRTFRENRKAGVAKDYFNQFTDNDRLRKFGSVRFGFDFFADNRNTISLSQNIFKGKRENTETQDQEYLDINKQLVYTGKRFSENDSKFNRNSTRLYYTHKFPQQGKELNASVDYNYGKGDEFTDIINSYYNPDGSELSEPDVVHNDGKNNSDQLTFQVDFSNPINENKKIEAGVRSYLNYYTSEFNSFAIDNGTSIKLPLSNNYKYDEMINAAYLTFTNRIETWGYQLGLRAEHSRFDGELIDSSKKFGYEYPYKLRNIWDALFPSVFISKQISEQAELQVNYSRRIRRPNFWQLNPYIDINDPVNLRQGNPGLRPEFINSFEFNYSQNFGRGNNFLGVIYYRNNPGDITRYSDTITAAQYQQLNNAAVDPNAILNTFINAQATNRLGAEFTLQQKIGKYFDIMPSIDMQYRKVKANFNDLDLNNEGFNWESKLIVNFKLGPEIKSAFKNFSIQLTGEYESPEVVPQGRRTPEYVVDLAFRKDFLKDRKANLTLSINDVFNSQRYGTIYDTEYFYQNSNWRRRVRSFRLVFTWKFGDADFSFRRNRGGGDFNDD